MSKGFLRETLALGHSLPRLDSHFAPVKIRAAAKDVERKLGGSQLDAEPAHHDLDSLHRRVRTAWQSGRGIEDLSFLDLRRLPWVLCYPPERNPNGARLDATPWLAENRRLLQEYGDWLSKGSRTRAVRTLLHVFLRDYPIKLDSFRCLRSILKRVIFSRRQSSLADWALRCRKYGLVKEGGSKFFADRTIAGETPVNDLLRAAGFVGPLERSAFIRDGLLGYLAAAEVVANLVQAHETRRLGRLLELLECERRLRFAEPSTRKVIAESLLSPMVAGAPPPAVKTELQRFFLRYFGDPRLSSGRQNWSVAREDVRRVVIRWLNEQSIKQFFRVVEETALDKHWRYRKDFWKNCFDDDLVDEVWFVLGSGARRHLRLLKRDGNAEKTTATLTGSTYGQSVLLLRMTGGVTIAEWSHNGACRMWLRGNPAAPSMYKPAYTRHDVVRGADHRQVHGGSEVGRWQNAIADWLYENTGLQIDRSDFPRKPWMHW